MKCISLQDLTFIQKVWIFNDIHISYEYIYDFKVNEWIQWMTIVFNSSVLQRTLLSILDDLHMKRAEPCWEATCDEPKWYDDRNTKLFIFFVLSVHSRAKWLLFWFLLSSSTEFLCQVSDNIVKKCWLDDAPSFQVSMKKSGVQVCFTYSMPSWIFLDSTFCLATSWFYLSSQFLSICILYVL